LGRRGFFWRETALKLKFWGRWYYKIKSPSVLLSKEYKWRPELGLRVRFLLVTIEIIVLIRLVVCVIIIWCQGRGRLILTFLSLVIPMRISSSLMWLMDCDFGHGPGEIGWPVLVLWLTTLCVQRDWVWMMGGLIYTFIAAPPQEQLLN
jgi:hypothetical protein